MKNYYQILEIEPTATQDEIRSQYRFLVHAWHPDKFPTQELKVKANEHLVEINEAYSILGDLDKRNNSDRLYYSQSIPSSGPAQSRGREAARKEKEITNDDLNQIWARWDSYNKPNGFEEKIRECTYQLDNKINELITKLATFNKATAGIFRGDFEKNHKHWIFPLLLHRLGFGCWQSAKTAGCLSICRGAMAGSYPKPWALIIWRGLLLRSHCRRLA